VGACFEALDECIFTAPSDLSCIFYHPNIAIGTMYVEASDVNTIKNIDEKPFSTEKYEQYIGIHRKFLKMVRFLY